MKVYLANMHAYGRVFAIDYEAADQHEAELIAHENDWEYLGELMWREECPDEVEAMIQLMATEPKRH